MFSDDAQRAIEQAKDVAFSCGEHQLSLRSIAIALLMDRTAAAWFAQSLGQDQRSLQRSFSLRDPLRAHTGKMALSQEVRDMLAVAKELMQRAPAASRPSVIALSHLTAAVARSLPAEQLQGSRGPTMEQAIELIATWEQACAQPASLGELTRRLRALRQDLLARVFGQHHAVQDFVEGLFSVEVVGGANASRRGPAGLFVFAGPPGVGKTFLADLGAQYLGRPFKRFDMSSYGHGLEGVALAGLPRNYYGAHPGTLTDFVQRNPNALLLFDEIEKAHQTTINLFLQILDAGQLEDKFTEKDVSFRDTIIILTTNAGRSLYDDENAAGVRRANSTFHRNSILDALRSELNPLTREPFLSAAICSRFATGYPILFNRLRIEDLEQIARAELTRVAAALEARYQQHYVISDEIPLALVMREGAQTDARTIKAQAETFLKEEVFKACQLFADERVDAAFSAIKEVAVQIDEEHAGDVARQLLRNDQRPSVLFVGDMLLGRFYAETLPGVEWSTAASGDQVFDLLTARPVDFILLDLSVPDQSSVQYPSVSHAFHDVSAAPVLRKTELHFDFSPPAARRFAAGQGLLEQLHSRMADVPVYLFSLEESSIGPARSGVDEELLLACVRAGGARGVIRTSLGSRELTGWEGERDRLSGELEKIAARLAIEHAAAELARQNKVLSFDTAPALIPDRGRLQIRCRNFRQARAVRSADASAMVTDVERPATRFEDVIGATGAKEALTFIRDWLREPKKHAAAGVEPPRGILLTGAPGTGKTMLARALAGESDCAFLAEVGSNFVGTFQGSGPENVRALFERARRYAPSVVFIDEIDPIGAHRSEARAGFVGHGEAMALNQLLAEMDGFSRGTSRPVIVIAATNHPEKLDPALKRRFSREIEVELPTRAERELYLRTRLGAKKTQAVSEETLDRLAAQTQGMSIAHLERVLAHAAIMALPNAGVIDDAILGEAFEKVTMGEAKAGTDPLRIARHEAGHALVMCELGDPPIYTTIVGRGNFGGYAAFDDKGERGAQTKLQLENLICQLLGGREAERLYYGEGAGDSTGPSNDLEHATSLAERMVYEFGMSEQVGFVRIDRLRGPFEKCHVAVRAIIDAQSKRAQHILQDRREVLDRVVQALMDRNRLAKHELLEIVATSKEAPPLVL